MSGGRGGAAADPGRALASRLRQAIGGRPIDGVAAAAEVDRRTIYRALRGERAAGMETATVQRLAAACGVPAGWLAFGEGERAAEVGVGGGV